MGIRFHTLIAYAHFHGSDLELGLHPEWNTLLDSGGFTNFTTGKEVVTLDDYIHYLKHNGGKYWNYLALDRIGDKVTSLSYLAQMRSQGLRPVPIYQRGQTTKKELVQMITKNPLTAIGGISQNLGAKAEQEYLRNVMRVIKTVPNAKVHLLGVGLREANMYNPFSADSSTWSTIYRYGIMRLWHQGRMVYFQKHRSMQDSKNYVRPTPENTRILLQYGLTWDDLYDRPAWGDPRSKISIANARAWIRCSRALYRKGCRYMFASFPHNICAIKEAWNYERASWGWRQKKWYVPELSNQEKRRVERQKKADAQKTTAKKK